MALQVNDVQGAIRILEAYERLPDGYGSDNPQIGQGPGKLALPPEQQQDVAYATRILNEYASSGGDISGVPQSLLKYTTPEYANFIATRSSTKFRDYLPLIATLGGGLAGVFGGAAAAGAGGSQAAGTEAAATYGGGVAGGGEFGVGATTYGGGAAAAGGATAAGGTSSGGASSGGMQPGVGEYGELGELGWEGGIPGGPGVTSGGSTGTALQRILDGTATTQDYLSLTGQIAPSLLGIYASDKQTDALKGLSEQYQAIGAPYRSRLEELYANPNAFLTSPEVTVPVQQGTDIMARSLSTSGNPIGSGNALQQLQSYSADQLFGRLGQEKDRLAGFGGLASYNAAAPAAATNAIGSQANIYNAIGGGIADVFTPRRNRSLADILRESSYA